MILIGQFDSPFVRRVGVALHFYQLKFEHRPWSVWADAERIAAYNPLRRVPTLVLEDGTSLVESTVILDELDRHVSDAQVLLPRTGTDRTRGLRVAAFATGAADKAVSLFYEGALRKEQSDVWVTRCKSQIFETLDLLERERQAIHTSYWLGEHISHADIAVACVLRFTSEAHPGLLEPSRWPALHAVSEQCEALPAFREIAQPFKVVMKND